MGAFVAFILTLFPKTLLRPHKKEKHTHSHTLNQALTTSPPSTKSQWITQACSLEWGWEREWSQAELGREREHCTVPDQLVVDKELEFRVEVGKTDTEGGPVVGREHREEVVDRGTVSTTHKHATDKVKKAT